ncbi:MAG: AAA family ATPase [Candidatus Kryptoniota bacterium]
MKSKNQRSHPSENYRELSPDQLTWRCPESEFKFNSTEELEPIDTIIGQERAVKALQFGVDIKSPGYNIFVSGLAGTGKLTTIKRLLEEISVGCTPSPDRCYVYNFREPDNPSLLEFERGQGKKFKEDIDATVRYLVRKIPELLTGEAYTDARNKVVESYEKREKSLLLEFQKKIENEGFTLLPVQIGTMTQPQIFPTFNGKPIALEELEQLAGEGKVSIKEYADTEKKLQDFRKELTSVARKGSTIAGELMRKVEDMERQTVSVVVESIFEELESRYRDNQPVIDYLKLVQEHTLNNIRIFKRNQEQEPETLPILSGLRTESDPFIVYRVNLISAWSPSGEGNTEKESCPVVIETSPTYTNLFGTIERTVDARGFFQTDHTKIKAGALLRADGGYIVLNALDALTEPGVWKALKRTLMYRKLEIQPLDTFFQISPLALKPEPIHLNIKVIFIGDPYIYNILYDAEEDFKKIFKVKADFDSEANLDSQKIIEYARFISRICRVESLMHFDKSGVAAVIEYAARRAERQDKLWTRFSDIADLLREANFWASQRSDPDTTQVRRDKNSHNLVNREDVNKSLDSLVERNNLIENKIQEMIEQDTLMIDTTGERVGQLNGLSVYDIGYYSFGSPTRITAAVGMGKAGITSIEREVNLSGKIHDKGVMTLSGFLRERFAKLKALSLSASIAFEQSYSRVDGDSASSTELYALLSSLSNLPIKQGIAVTGSVNQKGDIQPIGGVNQKIEGFYQVCKAKGLTGDQGVIIPHQNVKDLVLRGEVIQAVKEKKFHVYPVERIEEGIQILTGKPAGKQNAKGQYMSGSVFQLVAKRLKEMAGEEKEKGTRKRGKRNRRKGK